MEHNKVLPHQARVNIGVMVIKGVLHIPQISKTGVLLSDCLMSYPGTLLLGRCLHFPWRCCQCILQFQWIWMVILACFSHVTRLKSQSGMDRGDFFRHGEGFQFCFLPQGLPLLSVIIFSCYLFNRLVYFILFFLISKPFLLLLNPVVGMPSCIFHQLIVRMFLQYFGMFFFIYIAWLDLGIFYGSILTPISFWFISSGCTVTLAFFFFFTSFLFIPRHLRMFFLSSAHSLIVAISLSVLPT